MSKPTSDLLTYIAEYGNYKFGQKAFGTVDALVLSQIVYMNFDEVIPNPLVQPMSLEDLANHPLAEQIFSDPAYGEVYRALFTAIRECKRYQDVVVGHYENYVNHEREHQFCGMVLYLPPAAPASLFVSFRGTDASFIGWKEDFNMAYLRKIPSQTQSVTFLNKISRQMDGSMIVAGHSKGGNLAIYSSANMSQKIQRRIQRIYSFDGPGFLPSFYHQEGYHHIEDRICKIIPEQSLIGLLFCTRHTFQTVQSYAHGVAQHDPLSWKIVHGEFLPQTGIARLACRRAAKVNHWMQRMDSTERQCFINTTFELIESSSANNVYDLQQHPIQFVSEAIRNIKHWERDKKQRYRASLMKLWK